MDEVLYGKGSPSIALPLTVISFYKGKIHSGWIFTFSISATDQDNKKRTYLTKVLDAKIIRVKSRLHRSIDKTFKIKFDYEII